MKIGTAEILMILVVALLVLGPEKMPMYAKKAAKVLNSVKGYVGKLSEAIDEDVVKSIKEVQQPLKNVADPLMNISKDISKPIDDMKKSISDIGKSKGKMVNEKAPEDDDELIGNNN